MTLSNNWACSNPAKRSTNDTVSLIATDGAAALLVATAEDIIDSLQ